jgi:hypothetical protein
MTSYELLGWAALFVFAGAVGVLHSLLARRAERFVKSLLDRLVG